MALTAQITQIQCRCFRWTLGIPDRRSCHSVNNCFESEITSLRLPTRAITSWACSQLNMKTKLDFNRSLQMCLIMSMVVFLKWAVISTQYDDVGQIASSMERWCPSRNGPIPFSGTQDTYFQLWTMLVLISNRIRAVQSKIIRKVQLQRYLRSIPIHNIFQFRLLIEAMKCIYYLWDATKRCLMPGGHCASGPSSQRGVQFKGDAVKSICGTLNHTKICWESQRNYRKWRMSGSECSTRPLVSQFPLD
jgi:hypothetical protein